MFRKKWMLVLLACLFIVMLQTPSGAAGPDASPDAPTLPKALSAGYIIGPGDVLDISVWGNEALTRLPIVRPDGFISFPLVGEIRAAGQSVAALKAEMEGKLLRYVPDIILSLDVRQVNSRIIYVIGKVNSPGRFNLNVDINVLQALATAGGLQIYARRNKIRIFREENGKTKIYPFDYDEVLDGKNLEQNILLVKGDVVVIP
jgi:polysaccharide export outer membrane protein